jgi:hypothetical protein
MHYSIQQDFARARHADLLKEADNARLAALAREGAEELKSGRFHGLLGRLQRQRARRPAPAV